MVNKDNFHVAIIGGGAAGMMAAIAAKETMPTGEVTLFEKNPYLGAKVIISGGGRCNVTTGISDVRELTKNYPRGAKFLMSALFRFPPNKVREWFENHGVPLKQEDDLRIFPISDNGHDVVGALEAELRRLGVEVRTRAQAVDIKKDGADFHILQKEGESILAKRVIITTGGNAYSSTGSTGDGYSFAARFGHTITPLAPSLNSFIVSEKWVRGLAGVSFEKVACLLASSDGEKKYSRIGPILFTHSGASGPAIFALSSLSAYEVCSLSSPMVLSLDFYPDEQAFVLEKRLQLTIEKHPQKTLRNFLDIFLPKSLCAVVIEILSLKSEMLVAHMTKAERAEIVEALKNFSLHVVGRGAGEEFVTAGGVRLNEVNTNTMESKICPGLFFAGEVLDVDGFTGGFNLHASWATGILAGECAGMIDKRGLEWYNKKK